jgi:glutathione synthase
MALTVAIQMDPVDRIDIAADSTFALALEAQARGHMLLYYGPRDISLRETKVFARGSFVGAACVGSSAPGPYECRTPMS